MPPDTAPAAGPLAPPPSEALRSSFVMRPFSPVPLIVARSMSSSRAMRRTPGLACAPEKSCIAGAADFGTAGDDAGLFAGSGCSCCCITAGAACAGDASSPLSSRAKRKSLPTRSPIFTKISLTVPADGEGTSIDALSDSKVINGSSSLTMSPGFTEISMIGTSLKSPISGTFTSMMLVKTTSLDSARRVGRRQYSDRLGEFSSSQTRAGFGLSGLMPYLRRASATSVAGTVPSSASAFSAATTTWNWSTSKKLRNFSPDSRSGRNRRFPTRDSGQARTAGSGRRAASCSRLPQ